MTGSSPLVAVLLGTDHHRFDRLVGWAETLAAQPGHAGTSWFVQHGFSRPPVGLRSASMLGIDELDDLLHQAEAVVTHGGPGLIMEARAAGHVPIVVPRDPALNEHVDEHQLHFTARIAAADLIRPALSREQFELAVAAALRVGRCAPGSAGSPTDFTEHFTALVDKLMHPAS